jgi:hypothetical protein
VYRYREHSRGKYHCTVDLQFDLFGISCMTSIDIESSKIDCLRFVVCPLLAQLIQASFLLFLLRQFTVLMKQTRQAVLAIKQSIFLDVYDDK